MPPIDQLSMTVSPQKMKSQDLLPDNLAGVSKFELQWALGAVVLSLLGMMFGWIPFPVVLLVLLGIFVLLFRLASAKQQFAIESRLMLTRYRDEIDRSREDWELVKRETEETIAAFSYMKDGVIVLSSDSCVGLINPAARVLLGLDPDRKLIGRPLAELVRMPRMMLGVQTASRTGKSQDFMLEVQDDLVMRPVNVRIDRIAQDSSNSLVVGLRDVTETQLVESMRREFIANVSHELKTPLAAIKGYAETVEDAFEDDPDAALHFMRQIRSQCLRLEKLVFDMMQLARAQGGKKHYQLGSVCIADCIQEAVQTNQDVADQKGIQFQLGNSAGKETAYADFGATLMIVNNLISNAVRYTPAGGKVEIGLRAVDKFVEITVKDNGVGIAPREQERIFERFYRVARSREIKEEGTGIGLALVKNLAVAMSGEVSVTSKSGEGATFEVLLPMYDEDLVADLSEPE